MTSKPKPDADQIHVRWMIRADTNEVLEIDRQVNGTDAIDEPQLIEHLRTRNCIGMVATVGQLLVGYMIYELHRHRLVLLRLAVAPDCQRRGYGRAMLEHLVRKLARHEAGRHLLTVDVPESNLVAHLFFKAMGLRATDVLRDHYDDGQWAYRFAFNRADRLADQLEELAER